MNIAHVDPFSLPSVLLQNKLLLPRRGGVYFVLERSTILYIGKAQNLRGRWSKHHRMRLLEHRKQVLISWLECENPERDELEKDLIQYHDPVLNGLHCAEVLKPSQLQIPNYLASRIDNLAKHQGRTFEALLLHLIEVGLLKHLTDLNSLEELKSRLTGIDPVDFQNILNGRID